ncbi:MAG: dTMP kinase [Acidobacteriota bacterium]
MKARFITFEGLDGSGKSTHLRRASDWLAARGERALVTREPGGTELGDALRGIFLDRRYGEVDGRVEALMVFASRRQHLLEKIDPALEAGRHVLCDRFTDSTLAYQGAGRGLDASWIAELDRLATGERRPDRTLLFDLPAEIAHDRRVRARGAPPPDRLEAEGLRFYETLREAFGRMARREPERFVVIDSSSQADETWPRVERALLDIFGRERTPEASR